MTWLLMLLATGAAVGGWLLWRAPTQAARLPKPSEPVVTPAKHRESKTAAKSAASKISLPGTSPGRSQPPSDGRASSVSLSSQPLSDGQASNGSLFTRWRRKQNQPDLVLQVLILIDADLRAGVVPQSALSGAFASVPASYCGNTRVACQQGGEIALALQADAKLHNEIAWSLISACWVVSEKYGASLSNMLSHVLGVCRQQRRAEQQLRAQLAAPQAGAKLLAGLPLLGLGLGFMLGANPLSWLFGSSAGLSVLTLAIVFESVGIWWVSRIIKKADASQTRGDSIARLAPLAAHLIAACTKAGANLPAAIEVSAQSLGEPIGHLLLNVVQQLRLGATPEQAWAPIAATPQLALLAQVMIRSAVTGAPIAESLASVAEAAQDECAAELERRARVAGVKVVAPLALCFLPAFMLVTVVPVIGSLLPAVLAL